MIKIIFDVVGIIGVVICLMTYFLTQIGKLDCKDIRFPLFNGIASILILGSLIITPNIPSLFIEISWLLISVYGVVSIYKARKKNG